MIDTDKLNFIDNEFPELLKKLTPDTPRKWGQMNAQQMVEHLTDYIRVATGETPAPLLTTEEHLPAYRKFLESEKQFRPGTVNPLNTGAPLPERLGSLEDAKEEYLAEMKKFHALFRADAGKKTVHPSFGILTYDDWIKMQYKHLTHHSKQFGLISE